MNIDKYIEGRNIIGKKVIGWRGFIFYLGTVKQYRNIPYILNHKPHVVNIFILRMVKYSFS